MAQVAVKCLGTGGTQEHRTQQPKAFGVRDEEMDTIIWIKRLQDRKIVADMNKAQHGQHGKPNRHERAKQFTDIGCTELLGEEEDSNDAQYNINDRILVQIMKFRQFL